MSRRQKVELGQSAPKRHARVRSVWPLSFRPHLASPGGLSGRLRSWPQNMIERSIDRLRSLCRNDKEPQDRFTSLRRLSTVRRRGIRRTGGLGRATPTLSPGSGPGRLRCGGWRTGGYIQAGGRSSSSRHLSNRANNRHRRSSIIQPLLWSGQFSKFSLAKFR